MAVGVLALQGSYNEHIAALRRLGVKGVEIKKPHQLDSISALIIPGGESTTMAKLAQFHNLKIGGQDLVGGLDCTVHRNFFGSQIQSFEKDLSMPELADKEGGPPFFRGVFIRASAILEVSPDVQILAYANASSASNEQECQVNPESENKVIVAVKQKNLLGTAFHPELTADTRWHSYFLRMARELGEGTSGGSIAPVGTKSDSLQETNTDLPIYLP